MADEDEKRFKFRAFLSYSRKDEPAVRKLHRRLEGFEVPKLFRKDSARLGRFFRDKDELGAAAELGDALNANINSSEWLIVCCSPAAAGSHWVNEEIKAFIATHGHDRVLAAVLEGEPHDAFPPVLKEKEPLAADFRKTADGEDLGFLKLVAGILGVDLGELRDRQAAAERARARTRAILASVFALLAVAASVSAVIAVQQRDRAQAMAQEAIDIGAGVVTKADDLSRKFGVPTSALEELLTFSEQRFDRLFKKGVDTPDLRRKRAELNVQFAELYGRVGETEKQRKQALAALALMEKLPPKEQRTLQFVKALAAAGDAEYNLGNRDAAHGYHVRAVEASRDMLRDIPDGILARNYLAAALQRLGDDYLSSNDAAKALPYYKEAVALQEYVYNKEPNDELNTSNLVTATDSLGSAYGRLANHDAAEAAFNRSITVSRAWLKHSPDSLAVESTLGQSLNKLAISRQERGDAAGALPAIEESVAIARKHVGADARDANATRNLAIRLGILSNILNDLHRPNPALLQEAHDIVVAQEKADPTNLDYKSTVSAVLGVLMQRQFDNGDFAGARATAREAVEARRALLGHPVAGFADPNDALASAIEIVGASSARLRDAQTMAAAYTEAVSLRRTQRAARPQDGEVQADLAGDLYTLAAAKKALGDDKGAAAAYDEAVNLRVALAKTNPKNFALAFEIVDTYQQLGLAQAGFDGAASLKSFQQAEFWLKPLVAAQPNNPEYVVSLRKTQGILKMFADSKAAGETAQAKSR